MPFVLEDAPQQKAQSPQGGFVIEDAPQATSGPIESAASGVGDVVNKLGTGLYRGLANALGAPRDISDALRSRYGDHPSMMTGKPVLPGSADIKSFMFGKMGIPEVNAESLPGRLMQGAAEGVGAVAPMLLGAPPSPGLLAGYAGLSGAGGQAGRELHIDPIEHPTMAALAPVVGSVLAPSLLAGARALFPSVPSMVKDTIRSSPNLQAASDVQAMGNRYGVPVTGPEAMGDPTLLRIQQMAEQSPQGGPLRDIMAERPAAQRRAVDMNLDNISPPVTPRDAAASMQTAAKGAINQAVQARTAVSKPYYEAAASEAVPAARLAPIFADIDQQLENVGAESGVGRQLQGYRDKLQSTLRPGSTPFGDDAGVGPLNSIYKETRDIVGKSKFEPGALDNEVKGVIGPINKSLGLALRTGNENIQAGSAAYQKASPAVNELRNSAVGDIAKTKNPTIQSQSSRLLGAGTMRPDEVSKTFSAINKIDPEAAPKFLASFVDTTFDQASKTLASGAVDNAGGKFHTAIAGTPYAKSNLRAAFNSLPDGGEKWGAFENTLKVFEANARRLPVGSPTAEKGAITGELSGGTITQPLATFSDWMDRLRYGRNLGKLAELFARSDSIDEMRRIAGMNPGDAGARVAIGTLLNASSTAARTPANQQ